MEIKEYISKKDIEKKIKELGRKISKDYKGKRIEEIFTLVNKDITSSIEGKDVLIIEDIIDTGRTLSYLREYLLQKNPKSLKICTLVDKHEKRQFDVPIDYNGFMIEDKFIVGHGFDLDGDYRNLPYIGIIEE